MKKVFILALAALLLLSGCAQKTDGDGMVRSYTQITQDKAREMMAKDVGKTRCVCSASFLV